LFAVNSSSFNSLLFQVDEKIEEKFLLEETPTVEEIKAAVRRQTLQRRFVPVFVGTALKNIGMVTSKPCGCTFGCVLRSGQRWEPNPRVPFVNLRSSAAPRRRR
jgi:hypothetical protein